MDFCCGEPDGQYYGWNSSFWGADGVATSYAGWYRGSNICGIMLNGIYTTHVVSTTWPGEFGAVAAERVKGQLMRLSYLQERSATRHHSQ